MRLWRDVPPEERVDEAFLTSRPQAKDDRWLHRRLRELRYPRCAAAAKYPGVPFCGKWKPCGLTPPDGMEVCLRHSGVTPPTSAQFRLRLSLERQRTDLERRRHALDEKIAAINIALRGLA